LHAPGPQRRNGLGAQEAARGPGQVRARLDVEGIGEDLRAGAGAGLFRLVLLGRGAPGRVGEGGGGRGAVLGAGTARRVLRGALGGAGKAPGEDTGQPGTGQRIGVDVAVGQGHHRMDGGDRGQPLEEGRGLRGAPSRLAVHVVGAGGHELQFLDEGGVHREGDPEPGDGLRLPLRHAARQPLHDGERPVQPAAGAHRPRETVVPEPARRRAVRGLDDRPQPGDGGPRRGLRRRLDDVGRQFTDAAQLHAVHRTVDVDQHGIDAVPGEPQLVGGHRVAELELISGRQLAGHGLERWADRGRRIGLLLVGGELGAGGEDLPALQPHAEPADRGGAGVRQRPGDRDQRARGDRAGLEAADLDPHRPVGIGRVVLLIGGRGQQRRTDRGGLRGRRRDAERHPTEGGDPQRRGEQRGDRGAHQRRPRHRASLLALVGRGSRGPGCRSEPRKLGQALSASRAGARSTSARSSA
jgi:hypothetical protein